MMLYSQALIFQGSRYWSRFTCFQSSSIRSFQDSVFSPSMFPRVLCSVLEEAFISTVLYSQQPTFPEFYNPRTFHFHVFPSTMLSVVLCSQDVSRLLCSQTPRVLCLQCSFHFLVLAFTGPYFCRVLFFNFLYFQDPMFPRDSYSQDLQFPGSYVSRAFKFRALMFQVSFQGSLSLHKSSMFSGPLISRVLYVQDTVFFRGLCSQIPWMFLGFLGCFPSSVFPVPLVSMVLFFQTPLVPVSYVPMVLFPGSYVPTTFNFHGFHDLLYFPESTDQPSHYPIFPGSMFPAPLTPRLLCFQTSMFPWPVFS